MEDWEKGLLRAMKAAVMPVNAEIEALAARCRGQPHTVSRSEKLKTDQLATDYTNAISRAQREYVASHPDPSGKFRGYSFGNELAQVYKLLKPCGDAVTQFRLKPVPYKTEVKDGRTHEHYAALEVIVVYEDVNAPHFYGAGGDVNALVNAKTKLTEGCDSMQFCGSLAIGKCKPRITDGHVSCVLETLQDPPVAANRDPSGGVAWTIKPGHYRLLKPVGWEGAISDAERVKQEMKDQGWDDTPPK